MRVRTPPHHWAQPHEPFVERVVEVGSFTSRYLEAGDPAAPTVFLIHDGAWGGSADASWASFMPLVASEFHVIAPDMLGFGGTDKAVFFDRSPHSFRIEHLAGLLDMAMIKEPVHVVGNSFGGSLALRSLTGSARLPARSITSIAGTGGPWRSRESMEGLSHWDGSEEDLRRVARLLIDDFPGFEVHLQVRSRWAQVAGHYRSMMSVSVPMPANLSPAREDSWPRELRETECPILLVHGSRDRLLEEGWWEHFEDAAPNVEVACMDTKHAPNIDAPEALWRILRRFLSRC